MALKAIFAYERLLGYAKIKHFFTPSLTEIEEMDVLPKRKFIIL